MTTPAMAALLYCGSFPPLRIVVLGLITIFAGYTTVYALNDLVDYRIDKKKSDQIFVPEKPNDLDAVLVRHPVARGFLPFRKALLWAIGWGVLTLSGAFLLNPFCVVIFLASCLFEAIYCMAWKSSYLKVILSGIVKTSGAVAAIFAVNPDPPLTFLLLVFFWLFFWEVGGQNIPNDWTDIEEDTALEAATVPVHFGPSIAVSVISTCLILTTILSGIVFTFSPVKNPFFSGAMSCCAGVCLLLVPAYRLLKLRDSTAALNLFNRASYYPATILAIVCVGMIF
jgi:4-hydroxybenzoate polyprenyltransferase